MSTFEDTSNETRHANTATLERMDTYDEQSAKAHTNHGANGKFGLY